MIGSPPISFYRRVLEQIVQITEGSSAAGFIARRALETSDPLGAPCVFCRYNGPNYWHAGSHAEYCPWRNEGGETERRDLLRWAIQTFCRC